MFVGKKDLLTNRLAFPDPPERLMTRSLSDELYGTISLNIVRFPEPAVKLETGIPQCRVAMVLLRAFKVTPANVDFP